jgi:2-polyprenyl-6-methoxyphenol hydroxylase-like FAD-dependent oxidoreductase
VSENVVIICKDPVHSKMRVAIVGGGIGGLVSVLALSRRGFQVHVFEKEPLLEAGLRSYPAAGRAGVALS